MKNVLVITWWPMDDALIQTYTLPYVRMIRDEIGDNGTVYLLTLEKGGRGLQQSPFENQLVHLTLPYSPLNPSGILRWKKNIRMLAAFTREAAITHLHSWCAPAGGIGWLLHRKTGLPLIADSFEPHADPMVETGTWKKNGPAAFLLKRWEKRTAAEALLLIANSPAMQAYAEKAYGMTRRIDYVKPACVDLSLFSLAKRKNKKLLHELGLENRIVLVYAGKFGGLYYKQEVFSMFAAFQNRWKDQFRVLLLSAHPHEEVRQLAAAARLPENCIVQRFVAHAEIPDYIGLGDMGICPIIPTPSRRACSPIKNGEYWAMGLPLLLCRGVSIDDMVVTEEDAGYALEGMNPAAYSKAIETMERLLLEPEETRVKRIRAVAEKHRNFAAAGAIYHSIYGTTNEH